jgi:putative glycosyltransferase (TIGR04348 family)
MSRPSVVIVSPAAADSNNGNWHTASRWQEMLAPVLDARIARQWPDGTQRRDDVLLALHARRSAESVKAWAGCRGERGLAVVLTGTDLYQDIAVDPQAQRSVSLANRLVVLQESGVEALPPASRAKARVIYQSTPSRPPASKPDGVLHALMVGHLREVKSPGTLFEAARLLAPRGDIRIDHIGGALEPALGEQALATQRSCANYRWLGALAHGETRERIRRAHLLVHASAVEGGAHVIMEAVCSATPVLASRIPGNIGMLGPDYEGYFSHGDAAVLAALLLQCRHGQQAAAQAPNGGLLGRLGAQCALRAPLFAPETERAALLRLVAELMDPGS